MPCGYFKQIIRQGLGVAMLPSLEADAFEKLVAQASACEVCPCKDETPQAEACATGFECSPLACKLKLAHRAFNMGDVCVAVFFANLRAAR
jgi:hypothetical protein